MVARKTPAQKALAKAQRATPEDALYNALRSCPALALKGVTRRYVPSALEYEAAGLRPRKFEWDIAVRLALDGPVVIEVQGGIWNGGAHGRGWGISRDMEKGNVAAMLGYRTLAFGPQHLRGRALWESVDVVCRAVGVPALGGDK